MSKKFLSYQDEMARLYHDLIKDIDVPTTKNVTFCVTNACQLRCTYCYEGHKGDDYMSFETAKKFVDMLIYGTKGMTQYVDQSKHKFIILEFIGGEPLLAVDLIDQILEYWVDTLTDLDHPWLTKWRASICSNGVNYFDQRIQDFLRKWDDTISLSITLDGNKELHDACRHYKGTTIGCYDVAHAACQDLMNKGVNLGSKMTYSPDNLPYMYDAMVAMFDDGYTEIASNPAFEPEYTLDDAKLYYQQGKKIADEILARDFDMDKEYTILLFNDEAFSPMLKKDDQNWCGGTGEMIACDWDGRIYPCIRYMPMSIGDAQEPLVIGTVDEGMLATPKQRKILEDLKAITRSSQSTEECFNCPIARGCAWCSGWNYQLYGTANKRCIRICPMHKSRALFNYYFWNKYYRQKDQNKRMRVYIPDEWALEIIDQDELDMIKELQEF